MTRVWGFRAGKDGELEQAVIEDGLLYPYFQENIDFSKFSSREDIIDYLEMLRPNELRSSLGILASQRNNFANHFDAGDYVIMPLRISGKFLVGIVDGDYVYDGRTNGFGHYRSVTWKHEFFRDAFMPDILRSVGVTNTFELNEDRALVERIRAVLETGLDPGAKVENEGRMKHANDGSRNFEEMGFDGEPDAEFANIEELAQGQVEYRIKSEFAGPDLAELVNAILHADGYFTRVSPPGSDGEVEILAAKGSLGFDDDKICVQVKPGDRAADRNVVLQLDHSMRSLNARKGLLVSIGGVDKVAKKELDREFFDMRLWQLPDLLANLYRTYHNLPEEIRAKLDLKQIWIPIETR